MSRLQALFAYHPLLLLALTCAAVGSPLLACIINLFLPKQSKLSGWVSTLAIAASFALSAIIFHHVWNYQHHGQFFEKVWFTIGNVQFRLTIVLDNLSVFMLLLITAIALPVHIYSMAYMKGDERYARYFAYLSFFCFVMMALVITNSLLLLYACWELVGFASYLLIGFWFTRPKAVQASKKAFIMNRVGDIALLIGILLIYSHYHSFDMVKLFYNQPLINAHGPDRAWLFIPGLCFVCGAMAKSAQFPLHTWLPDAMEGPTSVSALIHAATMVAAGIFLLGRVYTLLTPDVLTVVAVIGCFTAFMAATIALTQTDLKRILAYSTVSQLGFMMLAMGVEAYASSLFHLATHAFFKCLLFLSAGVIIHQMNHLKHKHELDIDPQDISHMGGLRKLMPVAFITCGIGALALIGFPFTSGYLSKDGILIQAFKWAEGKSWYYYIIPVTAILTSLLTVFYIARLMFKVFLGPSRLKYINPDIEPEAHEGDWRLSIPMVILALCSLFPLFSFNPFKYDHALLFRGFSVPGFVDAVNNYHIVIPATVNLLGLGVLYLAYAIYVKQSVTWFKQRGFLFKLSYNEWYTDRFYNWVVAKVVIGFSRMLYWFDTHVLDGLVNLMAVTAIGLGKVAAWFDRYIIDGLLHVITGAIKQAGNIIRGFQTGRLQGYLLAMLVIIVVVYVLKLLI